MGSANAIHLLGAGSIGLLFAHHLSASVPVSLLLRSTARLQDFTHGAGSCITITDAHASPPAIHTSLVAAEALTTPAACSPHISSLIVTTKANQTLSAMAVVRERLDASSVVVLLQNGVLAVFEQLCEQLFPEPQQRPAFILGSTTHGAFRQPASPFHVVHAGLGSCLFGLPAHEPGMPTCSGGSSSSSQNAQAAQPRTAGSLAGHRKPHHQSSSTGSSSGQQQPDECPGSADASHSGNPSSPSQHMQQQLRQQRVQEVMALLGRLTVLQPTVHVPPEELERLLLLKLVVNCCANPLSALLHCKNGGLLDNPAASAAWACIITEIKQALGEQLPGSCEELHAHVARVVGYNASNYNSMLQDVVHGSPTEIDYLNGYIVRHAAQQGLAAPWNEVLCALIKAREGITNKALLTSEAL